MNVVNRAAYYKGKIYYSTLDVHTRESPLRPGGPVKPQPEVTNPYDGSGYDISEGQRLLDWYHCSGL